MTILVCGASGLLGRELCSILENNNQHYIGMYHTTTISKSNYYKFNLNTLDDFIKEHKPKCIINCIVNRLVDDCEMKWNDIKKINIDIAEKLASYDIKIVHISTDYVFDGKNPPYEPNTLANPIQNYGMSKYISELRVMNKTNNYLIVRVPVLFTDKYTKIHDNAVTSIGKKLMDLTIKSTTEDAISIRRPVYIPLLANFIYDCILSDKKGIYHFYNPCDKFTKYEIMQKISMIIDKPYKQIQPSYELSNRPFDTELNDSKYDIFKYYENYNFDDILKSCFMKFYHPRKFQDCFLLIDLDGTLVDSETLHYESYNDIVNISREQFNTKIQNNDFDFPDEIKKKKNIILKTKLKNIKLMKGAEEFIQHIFENNINHAVVTNSSLENVNEYKKYIPALNKLSNWVVKNDYEFRKPNPDCFNLAISKYYKKEKYIVGFENTLAGYKALKSVTDIIYIMIDNNNYIFKDLDIYSIDSFNTLMI